MTPPPAVEVDSMYAISTHEFDHLFLALVSALAMLLVYGIFACYDVFIRPNDDIEAGFEWLTPDQPPAETPADSSGRDRRRPSRRIVISMRLFQYGERGIEEENADCSICLDEFTEGQICRLLPTCQHIFHRICIDQWLYKKRQCPLCRSPVSVRIVYRHPS